MVIYNKNKLYRQTTKTLNPAKFSGFWWVCVLAANCVWGGGYAQNIIPDSLLLRISAMRVKENGAFLKGSFPAYVSKKSKPLKRKNDCNLFYNALIGFTLNDIRNKLNPKQQLICDSITSKLMDVFPYFKHLNSDVTTYNFWRTDTSFIIPYTNWVTVLPFHFWEKWVSKHLYLPDDLDCTSLALLSMNVSRETAIKLHDYMQNFANDAKGNSFNNNSLHCIKKKYRKFGAYYVWFGKKYPKIFDFCVLCNILTFVQQYNLSLTAADSASLQLIVTEIKNNDYLKHPLEVSPYYGNSSVLLYHLARLMNVKNKGESYIVNVLDSLKPGLINLAYIRFDDSKNTFEKMLLANTILKLEQNGYHNHFDDSLDFVQKKIDYEDSIEEGFVPVIIDPQPNNLKFTIPSVENSSMPFFIANIPASYPYFIQRIYHGLKRGIFNYYCPAYYDALMLEYLTLQN